MTSPASGQCTTIPHLELLSVVQGMYDELFPHCLIPKSLFIDMICINHLRSEISKMVVPFADGNETALKLLQSIENFRPEEWAASRPAFVYEFGLIGQIFKSTLQLYCILSLIHLGVLLPTPELTAIKMRHSSTLYRSLNEAFNLPRLIGFMTLPVVVLGVESVERDTPRRAQVEVWLERIAKGHGTYSPLSGRNALRLLWNSGRMGWDECFDRSYAFVA